MIVHVMLHQVSATLHQVSAVILLWMACQCMVHTNYNLNETRVAYTSCTRMFLSFTYSYMHYQLPSCIGLHTSSPPLHMQSFILHAHTCAGCNMHHHHLYFHRLAIARLSYACSHLSMFGSYVGAGCKCL